jgi:hypothetical protein
MFPSLPEKIDVTPEESQRIDGLVLSLMRKVSAPIQLPTTLYHYTTPAGFKGIIESGVLRATHISYTNDGIELLHAVEVARSCLRDREQTATAQQEKTLLAAIEVNLTNTTAFNTMPIFISCFCDDGDLLSQWRGYGLREGGIAIGFDARKILAGIGTWPWRPYLVPVLYKDVDQRLLGTELIAGIALEYDRILKPRSVTDPSAHVSDYLTKCGLASTYLGALFKHRGFAQENEWRLIYTPKNRTEVKFLAKATHLSPFVELPIGTRREEQPDTKQKPPDLLPITEVWFGPGRYQEHAEHSCSALLSGLGYFGIPLKRSHTPFRSIA